MQEIDTLAFCKSVIGVVFALSALSKIKNFSQLLDTVSVFRLIPEAFVTLAARIILALEILIVAALCILQVFAFWLASALLVVFSIALASTIVRKIQTSCNCFGTGDRPISSLDLLRNFGLLCCSCGGSWLATAESDVVLTSPISFGVSGLVAFGFVLIWIHLSEIYHLFVNIRKPTHAQKTFHL